MSKLYYGLLSHEYLELAAIKICDILGNGVNNKAVQLLLETASAETGAGTIKDSTIYAGMGITQIDKLPFEDIKNRTRQYHKNKLIKYFDIDIDLVAWDSLAYNPLLSMIFTRLKYKLIPEPIPNSIENRAIYWKKYYNTKAGKGTVEHYLEMNMEFA